MASAHSADQPAPATRMNGQNIGAMTEADHDGTDDWPQSDKIDRTAAAAEHNPDHKNQDDVLSPGLILKFEERRSAVRGTDTLVPVRLEDEMPGC